MWVRNVRVCEQSQSNGFQESWIEFPHHLFDVDHNDDISGLLDFRELLSLG